VERRSDLCHTIVELLRAETPVAVLGEAGIGTSTLLRAVSRSWQHVLFTGGLRSLRTSPFLSLNRVLGTDVGIRPSELGQLLTEQLSPGGLLVIDDLQWVDQSTWDALDVLAERRSLLMGIRRGDPGERGARHAVARVGGTVVPVPPLQRDDIADVLRELRPSFTDAVADSLVERSAGNPGVLRQFIEVGELSSSLVGALSACLDDLDAPELRAVALLGFSEDPLRPEVLGDQAVRLEAAGVVDVDPGAVRLRHRVLGEVAAQRLSTSDIGELHRVIAYSTSDPGVRAEHLVAAGDLRAALQPALDGAAKAPPDRRSDLLALAARCSHGADRRRLLLESAEAAFASGAIESARRRSSELLELDGAEPSSAALAIAAECAALDGDFEATAAIAGRLPADAPMVDRARVVAAEALVRAWPMWEPDEAAELLEAADAGAGNSGLIPYAQDVVALVAGVRTDHRRPAGDAVDVARSMLAGEASAASHIADTLGQDPGSELMRAVVRLHQHGASDAGAPGLKSLESQLARQADIDVLRAHLAIALSDSGRGISAAELATEGLRDSPTPAGESLLLWALVEAELAAARLTRARKAYDRFDEHEVSPARALATVAFAWAVEMAPTPASLIPVDVDAPWTALVAVDLELRALRVRAKGDPMEVDDAFSSAAEAWSTWHRRGELRCRWAAADAALHGSGRDEAVDRLRSVERTAQGLGQRPLVAKVRGSLRSAGIRQRPHRGQGRGRLSAREVEVLELLRLGFTTKEAALALGVAGSTVDTQIESAMRKLDARTRLHAVSRMAEMAS